MSDLLRAHSALAWLTVSSSSVIDLLALFLSHSSFFITMGSVMWSEYLRMIDFSFQPPRNSSSPSRRCSVTSVPRVGLVDHLDGVIALAAGFPAHRLVGFDAGAAGNHRHLVGDDEGRIETDAELADQVRILGLVAGQRREEFAGAGLGDGAEVLDGFVARQADAVVGNGDGARGLVEGDANLEIGIVAVQARCCSSASKRSLSQASEALEISSRRKISLLLYKE